MAQGGVVVDDTGTGGNNKVRIGNAEVSVSKELHFSYPSRLPGLTSDPPIESILNVRPTEITVTAFKDDNDPGTVLFNQAEASFVQVSTKDGFAITFNRVGNLVQIVPSAPMHEDVLNILLPFPPGTIVTIYLYTLVGSHAGSNIKIDQTGEVDCPGTNEYISTTIDFI